MPRVMVEKNGELVDFAKLTEDLRECGAHPLAGDRPFRVDPELEELPEFRNL